MGYIPYGFASQLELATSPIVALSPLILSENTYMLVITEREAVVWSAGMVKPSSNVADNPDPTLFFVHRLAKGSEALREIQRRCSLQLHVE